MPERYQLDTLVALRILFDVLRLDGLAAQPDGTEEREWQQELAGEGYAGRPLRQERSGTRPGERTH